MQMPRAMNRACVLLGDLPKPPENRSGWPWTRAPEPLPERMPNGDAWPRISLVTPSFGQGQFIERTLRSVLLQGYPNLEYRVLDGGSRDGTVDILKKYQPFLDEWVSEKDHGQSDAINKGLARSSGDIFNWINSDDWFAPGCLPDVARLWAEKKADVLSGACDVVKDAEGSAVSRWIPKAPQGPASFFQTGGFVLAQPSTFIRRTLLTELNGVSPTLHFVMDWELYLRLTLRRNVRFSVSPQLWAVALLHEDAKTQKNSQEFRNEARRVLGDLGPGLTVAEKIGLGLYRSKIDVQKKVSDVLSSSPTVARDLAWLAVNSPRALLMRFYWGAWMKVLRS